MELPIIAKLKADLVEFQREMQFDLPRRLEEARAHGDLRENAEYDAAKQRQGEIRARIAQLQLRLSELATYSLARLPRDRVSYGSTVNVEDIESGQEITYRLLFPEEVDGRNGEVSIASPVGRALLNAEVGDEVVVATPAGRRTLTVVGLVTMHASFPDDGD